VSLVFAAILALTAFDAGGAQAPAGERRDAERQRPIPCSVASHGMGAVLNAMRGAPLAPGCDDSVDALKMPLDRLEPILPDQHPALYYMFASRLFDAGREDDALFWFYAGQLRYRIRLTCHPDLPRDTEPPLFGALQDAVGGKVNRYAGKHPALWISAMERVLEWDAHTANGFEPRAACRQAIADQRKGMTDFIQYVRDHQSELGR
jgi:hypothetical protein